MNQHESQDPTKSQRHSLQLEVLLGFLGFFSFLAVVQAIINVLQPEPKIWPALLALVLVVSFVAVWRRWRR
ncbi:hypothetical protein SFC07_04450 [Corynebacterium callunae]|uniref:hypothetical protein n=1 Tax=Corynebacterium callunae TaxID=1721 RepID=UPI0039826030